MSDRVERELERICALIVPYLCERTGLSAEQITKVMDAQELFWDSQEHVVGRMTVFGFDAEEELGG